MSEYVWEPVEDKTTVETDRAEWLQVLHGGSLLVCVDPFEGAGIDVELPDDIRLCRRATSGTAAPAGVPVDTRGLYSKYIVSKRDGTPTDPAAQYFVLRLDTDPAARHAALMYAGHVYHTNPQLAEDIRAWVARLDSHAPAQGQEVSE